MHKNEVVFFLSWLEMLSITPAFPDIVVIHVLFISSKNTKQIRVCVCVYRV